MLLLPSSTNPTIITIFRWSFIAFVSALILSWIDYCNSLYYGLPESTLKPMNRVFNLAARLVSCFPVYHHITPSLILLHWLPIKYRKIFKISVNMFKLKNCIYPEYLKSLIRSSTHNHYFILSITTLLLNFHFLMLCWSIYLKFFTF